jgi:hypothetical protein
MIDSSGGMSDRPESSAKHNALHTEVQRTMPMGPLAHGAANRCRYGEPPRTLRDLPDCCRRLLLAVGARGLRNRPDGEPSGQRR